MWSLEAIMYFPYLDFTTKSKNKVRWYSQTEKQKQSYHSQVLSVTLKQLFNFHIITVTTGI